MDELDLLNQLTQEPEQPEDQEEQTVDDATQQLIDEEIKRIQEESGFARQAQYAGASTFIGLAQLAERLGVPISVAEDLVLRERLAADVASEDSPIAGLAGTAAGTAIEILGGPLSALGRLGKGSMALGGGIVGGASGALEPVLTEDDSRLFNTLVGTGIGGALGGALGALTRRNRDAQETVQDQLEQLENLAKPRIRLKTTTERAETPAVETGPKPRIRVKETRPDGTQVVDVLGEVPAAPKLPKALAGASPRFNQTNIKFNNDLEKAMYIVGRSDTKSARHDDYLEFIRKATGLTTEEAQAVSRRVRDDIAKDLRRQGIDRGAKGEVPDELTPTMSSSLDPIVRRQQERPVLETREIPPAPPQPTQIPAGKPRIRVRPKTAERSTPVTDILERQAEGGSAGAARTSPVQLRGDRDFTPEEIARFGEEGLGPRTRTDVKRRTTPQATPEYGVFPGPGREVASRALQSLNVLRYGQNVVRGRGATRGSGTRRAMASAAAKTRRQISETGDSLYDYILRTPDPTADDIVATAPLQREMQIRVGELGEVYENLVRQYGSANKIPADEVRDLLNELLPSMMVLRKIRGELTSASDKLNAARFVKDALKRDEAIRQLFGTRCY